MEPRRGKAYLAIGALMTCLFFVGVSLLPQGFSEFAYRTGPALSRWLDALYGFTFEQLALVVLALFLWAPGLALLGFGISTFSIPIPKWSDKSLFRIALSATILGGLFLLFLIFFHFKGRAIVDDELTYAMQARLLSSGMAADPAGIYVPNEPFTILSRAGVTGKYLPGEPLLQVPGVQLGYPALSHLPLYLFTCCFLFVAFEHLFGRRIASLGVGLFAISPMVLFTAATGQSQIGALFALSIVVMGYAFAIRGRALKGALLFSFGAAIGLWIRPQGIVPPAAVFGAFLFYYLVARKQGAAVVVLILPLGLSVLGLLMYNRHITGSAFSLPWDLYLPIKKYGLGEYTPGRFFTIRNALENFLIALARINLWWLGWPFGLISIVVWMKWKRPGKGVNIFLIAGLASVIFQFFYYSIGVSDTGPIYHMELVIPLSLLCAVTIEKGLEIQPRLTTVFLFVHLLLGSLWFNSYQLARTGRLIQAVHGNVDATLAELPPHSLVLYETHCSEKIAFGWVLGGFPRRCRVDSDLCDTLFYPASPPTFAVELIDKFKDRNCFYYHLNVESVLPELLPCRNAMQYIMRQTKSAGCIRLPSTAVKTFGASYRQ